MDMTRIAIVTAVLATLAGGGATAPAAQAGCAFIVVWHDRAYWAAGGGPARAPAGGTAL